MVSGEKGASPERGSSHAKCMTGIKVEKNEEKRYSHSEAKACLKKLLLVLKHVFHLQSSPSDTC